MLVDNEESSHKRLVKVSVVELKIYINQIKTIEMNINELYTIAKEALAGIMEIQEPDFRLEQAEFIKKDKVWDIVVSYLVKNKNISKISLATFTQEPPFDRVYKKVKLDENKQILGFYIFEKNK